MTSDIYKTLISELHEEDQDLYNLIWLKRAMPDNTKYLIRVIPSSFLSWIVIMLFLENRGIYLSNLVKATVVISLSLIILAKPARNYLNPEYRTSWYDFLEEKGIKKEKSKADLEGAIRHYLNTYNSIDE